MCLSTILKYSDQTLKRIKNLIRGREAYIVTGVPHDDDLYISNYLGVPVLCPEPEVSYLYTTKSGSKRIFASAKAAVPPSEYDVYSLPQVGRRACFDHSLLNFINYSVVSMFMCNIAILNTI